MTRRRFLQWMTALPLMRFVKPQPAHAAPDMNSDAGMQIPSATPMTVGGNSTRSTESKYRIYLPTVIK